MKRPSVAGIIMLILFSSIILFHLLVITGVIPYGIVWGGRLQDKAEMYRFEVISVLLNLFFLFTVVAKLRPGRWKIPVKLLNGILWGMLLLFVLNTVGNLFSSNQLERNIFTPVTILLAICSYLLVRRKGD